MYLPRMHNGKAEGGAGQESSGQAHCARVVTTSPGTATVCWTTLTTWSDGKADGEGNGKARW